MKRADGKNKSAGRNLLRGTVVVLFLCLVGGYLLSSCSRSKPELPASDPSAYSPLYPEPAGTPDPMTDVDFAKFNHDSERHKGLPCLLCHQRDDDAAGLKRAPHVSCAGCHTAQFADSSHQICLTCHTESGSAELKPFPPMRSFNVKFDHQSHFKEANCATCHRPQGDGMSVPADAGAHATCYQCHTVDKVVGENNIGKCSTCHELGPRNQFSDSTAAIGFNFSHANHGRMDCASCHRPTGANDMTAVSVGMHSNAANSCATCHNGARAFGATDFTNCRKCHTEMGAARGFGVGFDHAVHAKSNCATCHKTVGKGVNFSVPNGTAAHNTCFQCHQPMKGGGGFLENKCFTCHKVGDTTNIAPSKAVIAGNFTHTKHGFLDCDSCHTSADGKFNVPAVAMHKASGKGLSCATCHNNEGAFGEDFTSCKRCHTGSNFKF